jgi:hypothetical protein
LLPEGIAHKAEVIRRAVALHGPQHDPAAVLATYGGFEIATMVGAMLEAAAQRRILLIDGFIVTSALLVAARMAPAILDYCVFAHCSDESGHGRMLQALGVKPVLSLGLRLGEGTGAALVLPLVQSAVAFLNEMATFSSAQVSERVPHESDGRLPVASAAFVSDRDAIFYPRTGTGMGRISTGLAATKFALFSGGWLAGRCSCCRRVQLCGAVVGECDRRIAVDDRDHTADRCVPRRRFC